MNGDLDDLPLGREVRVEPGLRVDRRCFLAMTASALGVAGFLPRSAYAQLAAHDRLTFEEFLELVLPEARRLVFDTSAAGQDAYLSALAKQAVRLIDAAQPKWNDGGQSLGPGTFIGVNGGPDGTTTEPFVALHWKMDPGTRVEAHAHTHGNVCTIGLEGEARVSNFEMVGVRDFDAQGVFRVKRSTGQALGRGSVNLVSLDRNYVHGIVAGPLGSRGLDITTRIKPKRIGVPYLRVEKPVAGAVDTYDAVWTDLQGMKAQDTTVLALLYSEIP